MMKLRCSVCRKNWVIDCDGQRRIDEREDGRIMCFDCRTEKMLREKGNDNE